MSSRALSPARLVALVCIAQIFVQLGAGYWPVVLPDMLGRWHLSNGEAGWITSAFYAAYMLSVPVLVTHTPSVPLTRAAASAMLQAPASPREEMNRIAPRRWKASRMGMLWIEMTP